LSGYVTSRGSESSSQSDLADAFQHRDESDIGDPDRPHQERHAAEYEEQRVDIALDVASDITRLRRLLNPKQ
jgi:hypothetical protein